MVVRYKQHLIDEEIKWYRQHLTDKEIKMRAIETLSWYRQHLTDEEIRKLWDFCLEDDIHISLFASLVEHQRLMNEIEIPQKTGNYWLDLDA